MKKIISMGIASAVLALTAIAASADIKATTEDKAENGKNITVKIVTTADIETYGFTVAATGLETSEENIIAVGDMKGAKAQADGSFKVTGLSTEGFKAGTALATITFTVTAENGSDAVVALGNMDGYDEALENLTLKVEAAAPTESEPSDPGTSDPSDPGTSEPTDPGKEDPTDPGEVPATGVALAVVPAVLAGAAVVVAKKRK